MKQPKLLRSPCATEPSLSAVAPVEFAAEETLGTAVAGCDVVAKSAAVPTDNPLLGELGVEATIAVVPADTLGMDVPVPSAKTVAIAIRSVRIERPRRP